MNILITGNIHTLSQSIVKAFIKDKPKIVLAAQEVEEISMPSGEVVLHNIDAADDLFVEMMAPYRFDAVIFLSTREEQSLGGCDSCAGKALDGLKNVLELCRLSRVERFVYLSSTEVYGEDETRAESEQPKPASPNGYLLAAAEQTCKFYSNAYGLQINVVRVPFVYSSEKDDSLIHQLLKEGLEKDRLSFPASETTACSLLHAEDVAQFLQRLLDERYNPETFFINLASSDQTDFAGLQNLLKVQFPRAKTSFDASRTLFTRSAEVKTAKADFNWLAMHDIKRELPGIIEQLRKAPVQETRRSDKVKETISESPEVMRWVELVAGAGIMHWLNTLTGTLIQFRFVDFRLLFVVMMGSLHGIRFGLLAALLASASILYSWFQSGMDWALLLYNVENWLPIAMYLVAGAATGYQRDKKQNEINFQDKQLSLMDEKYSALYKIYNDIAAMKERLREQLLGYRDSFGRLFRITQDLDTYHEDDIFLRALGILEDFLANKSIAIYTMDQKNNYARLIVNSQSMNDKLAKSLDLREFPKLAESLDSHEIFQNTGMLSGYPAYAAPTYDKGQRAVMIVIWQAGFDQYSMYFFNLVKVISGLVQSSLVRAALFHDANENELYLAGTKILTAKAFKQVLAAKLEMRNNRIADFKLLKVEKGSLEWPEFYEMVKKGIRTTDYVGQHADGSCYILFSQANDGDANEIMKRLQKLGIHCQEVEESEVIYV